MDSIAAPLLIFDSGIGGLSVLGAVRAILPLAPIIYAADYAAMPYGDKPEGEIAARVPAILGRLAERFHPSLICIACNTASTIALPAVRAALDLPIVGTVPAIKPAGLASISRVIGVLGTEATIRQAYVDRLHIEFAADARLIRHGAPELVLAAEATMRGETPESAIFDRAIAGLVVQDGSHIDVIVLACTHFALIEAELRAAAIRAGLHSNIMLIDGAAGIARRVATLCADRAWPTVALPGRFVTTGPTNAMLPYRATLERFAISTVERF